MGTRPFTRSPLGIVSFENLTLLNGSPFDTFLTPSEYNSSMPRIRRAIEVGFPHHIVQRGNGRQRMFFNREDRLQYLDLLKKYQQKWESPILSYCLMGNHVHLLLRPKHELSLCKMMQGVALSYTQYVNRKYRSTGRLWECRYHSSIVEEDLHLWAVVRYIELNPVRARIVEPAEDYPFSSARAHLNGILDDVLGEKLFPTDSEHKQYAKWLMDGVVKEEGKRIGAALKADVPFGSESFINNLEEKFGRKFAIRPRGRPKHG